MRQSAIRLTVIAPLVKLLFLITKLIQVVDILTLVFFYSFHKPIRGQTRTQASSMCKIEKLIELTRPIYDETIPSNMPQVASDSGLGFSYFLNYDRSLCVLPTNKEIIMRQVQIK